MVLLGISWNLNFAGLSGISQSEAPTLSSEKGEKILLYPNPATTELNFEMGDNSCANALISINDMSGRKLLMLQVKGREVLSIPLDRRFVPGDYAVTITNGKSKIYRSFKVVE